MPEENIKTMISNIENQTLIYILFGVILLLLILFIRSKFKNIFSQRRKFYSPRAIFTPNEKDCFKQLKKEFPEYHICPQVSMGALLEPNISSSPNKNQRSEYTILRNKIQSKVIDFVMLDSNLQVSFIIELDDKSHDTKLEQDAIRDRHFAQVGIPTVRFRRDGNSFLNREQIEEQLSRKKVQKTSFK